MENIIIKQKKNRRILTYKLTKADQISTAEQNIINQGLLPELMPVTSSSSIFGKKLQFVIEDGLSLSQYLGSTALSPEAFLDLVLSLLNTLQNAISYGLRISNFMLSADDVYIQGSNWAVSFIYWPVLSASQSYIDPARFFMEIGQAAQYSCQDPALINRYMQYVQTMQPWDASRFYGFLTASKEKYTAPVRPGDSTEAVTPKPPTTQKRFPNPSASQNSQYEGTIAVMCPSLMRLDTKETVPVSQFPFILGRQASAADYCIEGDTGVSRTHAMITMIQGKIILRDMGSKNGTFYQGRRLTEGETVQLRTGDKIQIGQAEFVFYAAGGQ